MYRTSWLLVIAVVVFACNSSHITDPTDESLIATHENDHEGDEPRDDDEGEQPRNDDDEGDKPRNDDDEADKPRDDGEGDKPRGDDDEADKPRDEDEGDKPRDDDEGDKPRDEDTEDNEPRGDDDDSDDDPDIPPPPADTTTPPPPPPPPPPGPGITFTYGFNSVAEINAQITCAGTPAATPQTGPQASWCPLGLPSASYQCIGPMSIFPAGSVGCYRKHTWNPTAGRGGSGAIIMHWFTGMNIGFSPIWIHVPGGAAPRHFEMDYWVKQSAILQTTGSNVKMMRSRTGTGRMIGTLLSGGGGSPARPVGGFRWFWERWNVTASVSTQTVTPADNQWHHYRIEMDNRSTSRIFIKFWLDGVLIIDRGVNVTGGDQYLPGLPLILSPFVEMVSTGGTCDTSGIAGTGRGACINTGNYIVDDFTYTEL